MLADCFRRAGLSKARFAVQQRWHLTRRSNRSLRGLAIGTMIPFALSTCGKSEPSYESISTVGRNYLPYNLAGFTITDQFGHSASGGGDLEPGAGGGKLSCCYALKGTQFKVEWQYYDVDQWHRGDKRKFDAEATATLAPTKEPDEIGDRILEVHFYPDRHVELRFPAGITDSARLPMVDVIRALLNKHGEALADRYENPYGETDRRIARVVAQAWLKYRLTDERDLEQYACFALLVNPAFDADPLVQSIIQTNKGTPGALAAKLDTLPPAILNALKSNHFEAVPVPRIAEGLLPPPIEESHDAG